MYRKKEELNKLIVKEVLANIEKNYNNINQNLKLIDFTKLNKENLIDFLNNSNQRFLDTKTGKFTDKFPDENLSQEILIRMCERQKEKMIEKEMITILEMIGESLDIIKDNNLIKKILENTSISNNYKIRKKCALTSLNYIHFFNDDNEEIRQIALAKSEYYDNYDAYSKEEKQLIVFLEQCIKAQLIVFNTCPVDFNYDYKLRNISSNLFNETEAKIKYILTEFSDKKIVANIIYNMLLESKLTFNQNLEPSYWQDILKQNGLQKVIVYKKI